MKGRTNGALNSKPSYVGFLRTLCPPNFYVPERYYFAALAACNTMILIARYVILKQQPHACS
jgi:hypothetical protein